MNRRCGFSSILSRLVGTRVIDTIGYAGCMWVISRMFEILILQLIDTFTNYETNRCEDNYF